ncbi:MAG: cyclic lactone autoinducer peptide [Oscillospiraceae bacterium]|jgi:cyclic lactone autoinducer peptide|nr:cyclic lactone autoinducer peptide [Oscillospiraceae bacterium]
MKKFSSVLLKVSGLVASFALAAGVTTLSSACIFIFHQPKVPTGMEKFKK